ncbi:hypothetical protein O0I10_002266 [Lichtheimia ornata]|uniref:Endoglucanase n=1 Tax=Lichtheimia ornata TaxID=688661 RepID=A0AAD7VBR9_9FUNG|nr:uncharacterized protein O0I10_002266 [Lichtheimia ornata]KAJ8661935.1 hypothetical protein O0I10_002266 [Lichtheimia ornata]
MWFYEAQRSGRLPPDNRVPWRSDSALNDGSDHKIDLTGGYYDAGDYLKFTLPLAHSITLLAWGGIEWFGGYSKAKQIEYLRNTIRWGTDYLIKAHPEPNVLYVQVGDGDIDNNYWGPDTNIPDKRPSYSITSDAPGTDIAAQTSAAFASASYLFRHLFNDSNYADTLQSHAEALFSFADTAMPQQLYTEAVSASQEYYTSSGYKIPLVYAALWLYRASGNPSYRDKASAYFDQFKLYKYQPINIMDWSDPAGAIYVLGTQVDPDNTKYKDSAIYYLDAIIHGNDVCGFTKGGLLWCEHESESNALVPAMDTAFLALIYSSLDTSKSSDYMQFATSQIDYVLGNNYMRTPYVCGIHMNSPRNPHHAGASGGTDISKVDTSPPEEEHVLYGAVVGGPDHDDKFYDQRSDWAQTEVALDYNAPFQGLVAHQLSLDNVNDPPYASISDPRPFVTRPKGPLEKWIVAVIIVVIVFVVAGGLYICWWKRDAIIRRCCGGHNNNFESHQKDSLH